MGEDFIFCKYCISFESGLANRYIFNYTTQSVIFNKFGHKSGSWSLAETIGKVLYDSWKPWKGISDLNIVISTAKG